MFIRTENEISSVMPTSRWSKPEELLPYLEEEERGALDPLLGTALYDYLCKEYERLRNEYVDITSTTIKPTGKAKDDPGLAYADVTERMDNIQARMIAPCRCTPMTQDEIEVPEKDMKTIQLLRICQRIEFYKMLSHKTGLLTVSFNGGGGMNKVSADGYDPADDKDKDRAVKDAFMSAGRAVDDLLLFLEADAKGKRLFTDMWQEADAFYLHKDLLFQTARVLNEYLDIKGERMAYVALVRDIRFCQDTYIEPRIGATLLDATIGYANNGGNNAAMKTLLKKLRIALAFYVESRRTELAPAREKLSRRDSMTDAQQAMSMACDYIEENLDALGEAATDSPIYKKVKEAEQMAKQDAKSFDAFLCRRYRQPCEQNSRKLFTSFPATHRTPDIK